MKVFGEGLKGLCCLKNFDFHAVGCLLDDAKIKALIEGLESLPLETVKLYISG